MKKLIDLVPTHCTTDTNEDGSPCCVLCLEITTMPPESELLTGMEIRVNDKSDEYFDETCPTVISLYDSQVAVDEASDMANAVMEHLQKNPNVFEACIHEANLKTREAEVSAWESMVNAMVH